MPSCTAPRPFPDPKYALRKVLSAAAPGSRETGLRRLEESGVRVLTGTRVGSVKEGGVVVLQGGKVKRGVPASYNCTPFLRTVLFLSFIHSRIIFGRDKTGHGDGWSTNSGVKKKWVRTVGGEDVGLHFRERRGGVTA